MFLGPRGALYVSDKYHYRSLAPLSPSPSSPLPPTSLSTLTATNAPSRNRLSMTPPVGRERASYTPISLRGHPPHPQSRLVRPGRS